jgi:serine O-acetyltransferase
MRLWRLSIWLYRHRLRVAAKAVKAANFFVFHGLLPHQAQIGEAMFLGHHGTGVVVHPNTTFGDRVVLWHNVTIAATTAPGSPHRIVIGDDVEIGAGALIVAKHDAGLVVGAGAKVGAGAVVTRDVEPGSRVVGAPARPR